jgi:hydroxymethylpyrimidine pyrophosphatase-like HAD family hydrolase
MYRRVLAFDFDGTLAVNGGVSPEVEAALEQCRASGHVLFLVTGRRFETVALGHLGEMFSGIVWENGAVLSHTASGETYLPFGQIDPRLLKAMEDAEVDFYLAVDGFRAESPTVVQLRLENHVAVGCVHAHPVELAMNQLYVAANGTGGGLAVNLLNVDIATDRIGTNVQLLAVAQDDNVTADGFGLDIGCVRLGFDITADAVQ